MWYLLYTLIVVNPAYETIPDLAPPMATESHIYMAGVFSTEAECRIRKELYDKHFQKRYPYMTAKCEYVR